jgi:hypothetical protein
LTGVSCPFGLESVLEKFGAGVEDCPVELQALFAYAHDDDLAGQTVRVSGCVAWETSTYSRSRGTATEEASLSLLISSARDACAGTDAASFKNGQVAIDD